jgi:hypothetical protein
VAGGAVGLRLEISNRDNVECVNGHNLAIRTDDCNRPFKSISTALRVAENWGLV